MTELPPPVEGRERAARRWTSILVVACVGLIFAGIVAAFSWLVDLPGTIMWPAFVGMILGLVGVFVAGAGIGWTRGLPWYRGIWLGLRMVREAFCSFL